METVEMTELKKGDIFCHELKLRGREAFLVTEINEKAIVCQSRTSGDIVKKKREGRVTLLRHIDE